MEGHVSLMVHASPVVVGLDIQDACVTQVKYLLLHSALTGDIMEILFYFHLICMKFFSSGILKYYRRVEYQGYIFVKIITSITQTSAIISSV